MPYLPSLSSVPHLAVSQQLHSLLLLPSACAQILNKVVTVFAALCAEIDEHKHKVCVCVCVCERERERERELSLNKLYLLLSLQAVTKFFLPLLLYGEGGQCVIFRL